MDTKYLKRASSGLWLYRRKTPKALKDQYQSAYIQKSLNTHSLLEAQVKRNKINVEIDESIQRLKNGDGDKERFYRYFNDWRKEYIDRERELPSDAEFHPMEEGEPELEDPNDMVGWAAWNAMKSGEVPAEYRLSINELHGKWSEWAEGKKKAKYISTMKTAVKALVAYLESDNRPEEITIGKAQSFVDVLISTGKSSNTVTHYKSKLQELWEYGLRRELFTGANPWKSCKVEATEKQTNQEHFRNFTSEELEVILKKTEYDTLKTATWPYPYSMYALVRLLPFLGARLSELAKAQVEQFVLVDDKMFFEIRTGKTANASRIVPVSPVIRPLVDEAISKAGGSIWLFPEIANASIGADEAINSISSRFSKITRRFKKVEGFKSGLHSFRGHFATALEEVGCPEQLAAQLAGHKRLSLTYNLYSKYQNKKEMWSYIERINKAACLSAFLTGLVVT